jgi:hypothetical protein
MVGALVRTVGQIGPDRRIAVWRVRDRVQRLGVCIGVDWAQQDVRASQLRMLGSLRRGPVKRLAHGKIDRHDPDRIPTKIEGAQRVVGFERIRAALASEVAIVRRSTGTTGAERTR